MPPSQSASFSTTGKSRWMKALPERWINSLSTLPKRRARKPYAKNHPVLVVRRQPRRGDELLSFDFQKFKDRERQSIRRSGTRREGDRDGATFELDGQRFLALNGGPHFTFTPAISMFVNCETQDEIDELWEKLSAGGEKSRCGWLKDKFGLSWQIVPSDLGDMLQDKNPQKAKNTMQAMLQMNKLDIQKLRQAHDQG